ncbi:hypothetical protein BpHYR1_018182 [Brachionus plicatilis]|uniref:Cystatin domain-containing protein n=1 Tax=Brachionus plicatilis TaxID=10195 RepID=A0A3M7R5M8_BRAPC|nr:hypothetical protein BpHYR1_018182 [Brachionus plicatilis]
MCYLSTKMELLEILLNHIIPKMFKKIVILLALVALGSCQLGGLQTGEVTSEAWEMANWSTNHLSSYTSAQGQHVVKNIRDLTTQVVSGLVYRFTMDVSVIGPTGTLSFTCRVAIYDQSWTSSRGFLSSEPPKCILYIKDESFLNKGINIDYNN